MYFLHLVPTFPHYIVVEKGRLLVTPLPPPKKQLVLSSDLPPVEGREAYRTETRQLQDQTAHLPQFLASKKWEHLPVEWLR